jgi:hypothetical protein
MEEIDNNKKDDLSRWTDYTAVHQKMQGNINSKSYIWNYLTFKV